MPPRVVSGAPLAAAGLAAAGWALAGCAATPTARVAPSSPAPAPDSHVPPFASVPYEPFARDSVVAIALREWRLFGQGVDDDPPGTRPPPDPERKPERLPGLWQRVGEYWWTGQDPGQRDAAWTGKHDASGLMFPAEEDATYAWSAAFVSYVMRIAGAGPRFPYAPNHATYIAFAWQVTRGAASGWVVSAHPPDEAAPLPGDLICTGRASAHGVRLDDLPPGVFPSHCDIVVAADPGSLTVIGGNVDDAVTAKHIPVAADGRLVAADGTLVDTRYPWFAVIRVAYDR